MTFAIVWTLGTFALTFGEYVAARNALDTGRFTIVEGPVSDLKTTPKSESFTVSGKTFSYSDYAVVPGFNKMRLNGGPIERGMYVRITYVDNTILRLEIARSP